MNKSHIALIALIQAIGVTLYIATFVLVGQNAPQFEHMVTFPKIMLPMLFLFAFVSSALICSLIVFGFPAKVGLNGNWSDAMRIVIMTAAWLLLIGLSVFAILSSLFS